MKIQEIMTSRVETIEPQKSIRQAAQKMSSLGIGSLLVVNDNQLLGIITDRDIGCRAIAAGRDPGTTPVQKIMNSDVATCFNDQDLDDAATLMQNRHIRRLAILNHDNSIAGLLTVEDLAHGSRDLAGAVLEAAVTVH
jgi:CBS domain-containing protein